MPQKEQLLIIRFSALGDVAMTVPVIKQLLQQHPDLEVCMLSNQSFAPLFTGVERLKFIGADLKGRHLGLKGIFRLYKDLKTTCQLTAVADLHEVLRTKLLSLLFRFSGYRVAVVNKGRTEKKQLTKRENKVLKPLENTFSRYAAVFAKLGYSVHLTPPVLKVIPAPRADNPLRVGIAPFAQYREKTYPALRMKELIRMIQSNFPATVLLYGGKGAEKDLLEQWVKELPGVQNRAGVQSMPEELAEIAGLDCMISMDSANMHLASLFGVPVISVWGATHPFAGFLGWGQSPEMAVQLELACRPCSVFGNKPCYRGDWACMEQLPPELIAAKLRAFMSV